MTPARRCRYCGDPCRSEHYLCRKCFCWHLWYRHIRAARHLARVVQP